MVAWRVNALNLQQPGAVALLCLRELRVHRSHLSLRGALGTQWRFKLRCKALQRAAKRVRRTIQMKHGRFSLGIGVATATVLLKIRVVLVLRRKALTAHEDHML